MINIGIDFGTTNSCVSFLEGSAPNIIPNPEGSRVIPTIVAFTRDNTRIFGTAAKRQILTNPRKTISSVKRLLGRKFESEEVQQLLKRSRYEIVPSENGDAYVKIDDQIYSPQEIASMFFSYLRNISETFLGTPIDNVVVTVPAFYNDSQRQATKVAAEIAGLNVIRIINEPTAALLAYGQKTKKDGIYTVYDLGGGTFDISIIEVIGDIYKVIGSLGDTFLGGNDFDNRIADWIIKKAEADMKQELEIDSELLQRIYQAAEKAKIELSFTSETQIALPYFQRLSNGEFYHFQKMMTRAELEDLTLDLVKKSIDLVKKVLNEVNIFPDRINGILLVGGQSRMPLVSKMLYDFFKIQPMLDLNPEEVVAQGAAFQADIAKGRLKDLLLLDVTPLSLGVETKNDIFQKVVERNTTIPVKKGMIFTTIADNQTVVKIKVYQGEREIASKNHYLGELELKNIPLAPKGIPQISVTFEVDVNGMVKVAAKDLRTGQLQEMSFHPSSGLAPEEIEKMVKEAKEHEDEDKRIIKLNKLAEEIDAETDVISTHYKLLTENLDQFEKDELFAMLQDIASAKEQQNIELLEKLLSRAKTYRAKINQIVLAQFQK